MAAPTLVIMLGGMSGGPLEEAMRAALEASALDAAETALATGAYAGALLLADRAPALEVPPGVDVELDAPGAPFQFGVTLARAVERHALESITFLGGGSAPLLGPAEFTALADLALRPGKDARGRTNNFYSSDLFSLTPASAFARLDPAPSTDNAVPRRLQEDLGVRLTELPRSLATQLNLDTPIDLVALRLSGRGGPRLRATIGQLEVPPALPAAARFFTDRLAEVLIAGRVSSRAWQYLERQTASRARILSEERGMAAANREADGSARSLLGMLIAAEGPRRFFHEFLPQLCQSAFLDIRPALVQLGLRPSRADRFAADLGLYERIEDPALRELVEAAQSAPVPVVLGGHSLVAGVLMLVNDWAWEQVDGVRRPADTPL